MSTPDTLERIDRELNEYRIALLAATKRGRRDLWETIDRLLERRHRAAQGRVGDYSVFDQ